MILVQCSSAASPFVRPLWAGFVVSLVAYCLSCALVRHGGIVCVGAVFSMLLGIPFVISCIIDSLNLLGMPGFLLAGRECGGRSQLLSSSSSVACLSFEAHKSAVSNDRSRAMVQAKQAVFGRLGLACSQPVWTMSQQTDQASGRLC